MQLFQLTCFSAWFSRFSARHSSPFPTLVGAKTIGPSSFASANPRRRKLMSSLLPSCESSASVSRAFRVLQTKEKKEIKSNYQYLKCIVTPMALFIYMLKILLQLLVYPLRCARPLSFHKAVHVQSTWRENPSWGNNPKTNKNSATNDRQSQVGKSYVNNTPSRNLYIYSGRSLIKTL